MAQNRMKKQVDQQHSERVFQESDQVFLWIQPYKKASLKDQGHHKFAPKIYGSYWILKRIGPLSYKLALPATSKIHLVFHVSCLNKVVGWYCQFQTIPPELYE
jgi:hypothetical protein